MAYKIYQQLESGMAESGLVESSEVGYTQNADINATRFKGKTVAGALDNINNKISSLSSPITLQQPIIRVEYIINGDTNTSGVISSTDCKEINLEMGEYLSYSAQYYWSHEGDKIDPEFILAGSSWDELYPKNTLSNKIENNKCENSESLIIKFGKNRQGLIIGENNMIYPSIITDESSDKIDIIFKKRVFFGELNNDVKSGQDILNLNSILLKDDPSNKKMEFELNLPNDKLFVYAYPKSWGESTIIWMGEYINRVWKKSEFEIITNIGFKEEYLVYYSYKGAYKNNQKIIFS